MEVICKSAHICFLNCHGCDIAKSATKEEKKQAKKELKAYRKRIGIA
jgi:hypothetical protein